MQQGKEIRNYTLNGISYEHLVAVQLDAVLLQVQIGLDLWEVQDSGKMEREINVKVYPEQRLILHRIEFAVKVLVVIVLEFTGSLGPQRSTLFITLSS